jgi:ABC-2 type transport system ATP-binding protein
MDCAIRVEQLEVRYKSKKGRNVDAVRGLTFSVAPGEIVGFLGPNGAGKSSTLKALMGFVVPHAGECEVFGLSAGTLDAKRKIGYLPEVAMYYPYLTPIETLTLYGELQGMSGSKLKAEAYELLELVGIKGSEKKLNKSLSKGMLQRVGIAQSLLGNPQILILDEVTSGLDPVGRKELRLLVKDRQKKGATLFFSSHELPEVDMLCDRILLINQGTLVEERPMSPLKDELRNYSITFRGSAAIHDLAQEFGANGEDSIRARFRDKASLLQAIERIASSGGTLIDVVSQEGSLEEYFIQRIEEAA